MGCLGDMPALVLDLGRYFKGQGHSQQLRMGRGYLGRERVHIIPVEGLWDNRPGENGTWELGFRNVGNRCWGQKRAQVTGGSWLCSGVCSSPYKHQSQGCTCIFKKPHGKWWWWEQSGSSETSTLFLLRGSGQDRSVVASTGGGRREADRLSRSPGGNINRI